MRYIPDLAFTAALVCLGVGCWLAWAPLGLIVPSVIVLGVLIVSRIGGQGGRDA